MTKPNDKPGRFVTQLGFGLLAFAALWTIAAALARWTMCPAYVTLVQALLCFVVVALAAKGDALRRQSRKD